MKDPKRLQKNWQRLIKIHEKVPDWRMGQFLVNLISGFEHDLFYFEDDEFLEKAEEIAKIVWEGNF